MSYPSSLFTLRALTNYLTGKTFYAHLVTVAPLRSVTTVTGLALPTGGNYTLKPVTLGSAAADGTGARVSLGAGTSVTWPDLTTATPVNIAGMVICSQLGASPSNSDEFVAFHPYVQATPISSCTVTSGSPIVTTINSFSEFTNGMAVIGTGISPDSKILSIPSSNQLVLTKNTTTSGTFTLQISAPGAYTTKTSLGDTLEFQIPSTGVLKID
ncbi:MAG: hypothetical protein KME47_09685 [Nodosilinea sp. WJT8-NPBG4]|jgi:hypothetical protein|nr:hypothetical protein [Nodosilinea sp. WJT8-NPBG4]